MSDFSGESDRNELTISGQPFYPHKVNAKRGLPYNALAREFIAEFPKGTVINIAKFGQWLDGKGLLPYMPEPPEDGRTADIEWLAYRGKRYAFIERLNSAASHPRMNEGASLAYHLEYVKATQLVHVRTIAEAVGNSGFGRKVSSFAKSQRRKIMHLIEGLDFAEVSSITWERISVALEHTYQFEEDMVTATGRLDNSFRRVKLSLAKNEVPKIGNGVDDEQRKA